MENKTLELTITGADLASELRRMVIPTLPNELYFIEVVKITEMLTAFDKTWDDIDKLTYVVGMRAPYHLDNKKPSTIPTSVDGYEVTIHLK